MRIKDEFKQEAVINATVKLVNQIGFVSSSVSKIAKEANVSPATIYIYYKNKEELLVSTYVEIKKTLGRELLKNIDEAKPFRDILFNLWMNGFDFITQNRELFQYTEQFASSPYSDLVDSREYDVYFEPIYRVLKKGTEQKIIKDVPFEMLAAFIFFPLMTLQTQSFVKV